MTSVYIRNSGWVPLSNINCGSNKKYTTQELCKNKLVKQNKKQLYKTEHFVSPSWFNCWKTYIVLWAWNYTNVLNSASEQTNILLSYFPHNKSFLLFVWIKLSMLTRSHSNTLKNKTLCSILNDKRVILRFFLRQRK